MKYLLTISLCLLAPALLPSSALPCTNILVSRAASRDASTMITYAADAHVLYGELYYTPAAVHTAGAVRPVYDWDSGDYLGTIKQPAVTYSVVGNMNEHQLAIGETTFGGRKELRNLEGGLDYGSLIYVTLERAKTARQAIELMGKLVAQYGYRSKGESFSIADTKEVWIMEMIGKGPGVKGAVWVARRIPDGYISAHANQARIRTFPLRDKKNAIYSKDVISFARKRGYFKGQDKDFSFTDAYSPMTYRALRICEARVWSVFRRAAPSKKLSTAWIKGDTKAKPLPLFIKPDKKLSVRDTMGLMRDHFQDSEFYLGQGVGAGPYKLPYRWRPLYWEYEGKRYLNERAISTQQTGFSFVTQSRASLPNPIGGILWFGVDDTYSTVYVPMYAGIRQAPHPFAVGTSDFEHFSWDSAFWVFNFVANLAYSRYSDMIVDIQVVQEELESDFEGRQAAVDSAALALYKKSPELARDYLTDYSSAQAERTVKRWRQLGLDLFVKYLDGNVRDEHGRVTHPAYPKDWYQRIVKESGDHLLIRKLPTEPEDPPKRKAGGYYHSRQELGPMAKVLPKDFSFAREKLVYIPGDANCGQPKCCLQAQKDSKSGDLVFSIPKQKETGCGSVGWLGRLPKDGKGKLIIK